VNLPKQKPQKPEVEVIRVVPEFSPQFREDLLWWAKTNPRLWERLWDLIESIVRDPFAGIGKPEPLKHLGSNLWSRRINLEHRLVYQVEQNRILFLQARYHYEN
jgi:toxin YoeB